MENKRILNRIVFINIANTDYANVEIAGNTCFVGTNNMGKTTLQRAILFFYSANTRGLGISTSQKVFEDYYFQYPNSYIIYEVATETGFFHVMVYRNNKIFFRFVEAPFDADLYIQQQEALLPKAVLARLNEQRIGYSDQVETFERYRNIIYGADPDKKYKPFALMKGNASYHNIPLAITSIFLSSESVIRAEFVKECIANAIGSKHTTIELKTIERQLRQFTERYHDIETFFRKENAQRSGLIRDNFAYIVQLKNRQRTLATELGSALKWATGQQEALTSALQEQRAALEKLEAGFREWEEQQKEKSKDTHQEIGGMRLKLREADRKWLEYEEKGMADLLREEAEKEQLQIELKARQEEYATLTAGFSEVEQQFKTLLSALNNEQKELLHAINTQRLTLEKKWQEERSALRDQLRDDEVRIREEHRTGTDELKSRLAQIAMETREAAFHEKEIRQKNYFSRETTLLKNHLDEVRQRHTARQAALSVKNSQVELLKKESAHVRDRHQQAHDQFIANNKREVANCQERIAHIDEKLRAHQQALYGYLQEHYPDWYQTIGKVCSEELLFSRELNPKMVKKGGDSLYGIQLDLGALPVQAKTLEQYELERIDLREQLVQLNQAYLVFREEQAREEQSQTASLAKKMTQLRNEIAQMEYEAAQDGEHEKQYELDLQEWRRKGEQQREKDLLEAYARQETLKQEAAQCQQQLAASEELMNKTLTAQKATSQEKITRLQKTFDKEMANLEQQRKELEKAGEEKRTKLLKEKSAVLRKKGVDDCRLQKVRKEVDSLQQALAHLDVHASLLNDFRKDKRELFDRVDEFRKEKERLEERIRQWEQELGREKENHAKQRKHHEEQVKELEEQLRKYANGLRHFEEHFKGKLLYDRLRHLIEPAPEAQTSTDLIGLCSLLQANDNEYHNQFDKFRGNINELTGRFRPDNHLNFKMNAGASEVEYERFAAYLEEFYAENKIQVSIAEVAKSHGMLIDAIASKMKALTEYKGRIDQIIGKMEADFSKASFDSSKLIEYVKLKSEDSENKVLRKLQKIAAFREQNPFMYGEANLFNTQHKAKGDIDRRSVELLNDLQKTITEEHYEEINVKDLFELRFRIKEGKNDTGWIEKIDKVGSTGTDMLVKAVIYITLLNVFINESTQKGSRNFGVHCIIDEVGQISAPYLKELIAFAADRNICLINGLPNESKLETHYNYTYKFRRDAQGYVKVVPLLTMSVEP